ncbi:hypothetical protein ACIBCM_27035 [Streptomyces sp. NPDC051018]|uniref:hypothetical protein n=1 Tax=Streptomyces sp. NPDC051018 TaxID=3365639 RepID=UPI00379B0303
MQGNDAELTRGRAATPAGQAKEREGAMWRQLRGGDNRRINLTHSLRPAAGRTADAPAAGRLSAEGPGGPGLPDIVSYYCSAKLLP